MNLLEKIKEGYKTAVINNHRRIIVIYGENTIPILSKVIKDILSFANYKKMIFLTSSPDGQFQKEIKKKLENLSKSIKINFSVKHFKDSDEVMGTTQEIMILDFTENLEPNDVGKVIESVKGGGFIIMLTPNPKKWEKMILKYHQVLITPPYTEKDIRHIFIPWFWKKLNSHDGILIIDSDNKKIVKNWGNIKKKGKKKKGIEIPKDGIIPRELYEICITQDQVNVLKELEKIYEGNGSAVIIANRGRGKSAVVGLFTSFFLFGKKKVKVGITSPDINNVQTFFEFLIKGLKKLGVKFGVKEENGKIFRVRYKKSIVEYYKPYELSKKKRFDLVFVDEAAGVPITLLTKIYEKFDRIIFASTIHGYEGAGRSFSVRFMKKLEENPKETMIFLKMREPIRYGDDDPIEEFVYKALLLDAEPKELKKDDLEKIRKKRLKYIEVSPEELFSDEDLLRQFVGIYVLAHYRNRPNDLMLLADAPHHFPRITVVNDKVVNSIQIAREGGLNEEWIKRMKRGEAPSGNIIPDRVIKYYGFEEFGKEVGYRIVRIATHPKVMSMGIGSFALKKLENEAKKKKFGWIGSGFGVNYKLLKFWIENGFVPIHISPSRNEVSGEFSVLVIKPLKKNVEEMVKKMNKDFREKMIECLPELYYDMEPDVVRLLLKPIYKFKYKLDLSNEQVHRLKGYVNGIFTMETVLDVIKKVTDWYFLNSKRFLSDVEERVLIVKILQYNRWKKAKEMLNMKRAEILSAIRKAMKNVYREVFKEESL